MKQTIAKLPEARLQISPSAPGSKDTFTYTVSFAGITAFFDFSSIESDSKDASVVLLRTAFRGPIALVIDPEARASFWEAVEALNIPNPFITPATDGTPADEIGEQAA